ncbi:hypothetical protein, partial [Shewanella colwelliana]|uniref:hypothetical protein n=1 Tax=Shewanella colwelliana TaxID=23 RepID=UPI0037370F84
KVVIRKVKKNNLPHLTNIILSLSIGGAVQGCQRNNNNAITLYHPAFLVGLFLSNLSKKHRVIFNQRDQPNE